MNLVLFLKDDVLSLTQVGLEVFEGCNLLQMKCDVAQAVKDKRILSFKEMLEASGFPDLGGRRAKVGSDLTGDVPVTHMLLAILNQSHLRRELCARAARVRKASVNEVRGSGDADIDEIVWQKWMKGWLVGPLVAPPLAC